MSIDAKRIYIWGTGANADLFMKKLSLYLQSEQNEISTLWDERVAGFIDGNEKKQGGNYQGKPVVSLKDAVDNNMDYCVVTVADNRDIIASLENEGLSEKCYATWKSFLRLCKDEVLSGMEKTGEGGYDGHDKLSEYLNNSITFSRIDNGHYSGSDCEYLDGLDLVSMIGSLEWYCGEDAKKALRIVSSNLAKDSYRERIKTVGIVIERFRAGGIERMVSILSGLFCDCGYRVVLITDEEKNENDYHLHRNAIRYVMKNKAAHFSEDRLDELRTVVNERGIDIVCYHGGYARIETFYELLLFRLMNIPSTIEIHSAFRALLADHPTISDSFPVVYQMADRVITISQADLEYWSSKGCRCVMIPNPVGDFGVHGKTGRHKDTDHKTVLWIGRIVQNPKRVMDTIPIMQKVVKKDRKIRLIIVGARDNDKVYNELISGIDKAGLGDNITVLDYQRDVGSLYKNSDAVLMTSSSECYPNVIIEAKSYSRPIVMYEIPWLELTADGKGIIIVKQKDTAEAAEAIVNLLNDESLWEQKSDEAWRSAKALREYNPVVDWKCLFDSFYVK